MNSANQPAQDPKQESEKKDSNAEAGKKAIDAAKLTDPAPKEEQEARENKDAEQWRNEG